MTEAPFTPADGAAARTHTVLCVDDEKNILNALRRLLRQERFRLVTAGSGAEALEVLERTEAHLVVSDQRMPEMSGVEFLSRVKERHPDVIRIILSGYTDVHAITEAVNKGHIYKFLLKPWNDDTLKLEVRQALQQYDLVADNRRLHERVVQQNDQLRRVNETLERMVSERTHELELKNQALELSHAILEDVPFPVLGISADGMVAFVNHRVQRLEDRGLPVHVGDNVLELLPPEMAAALRIALVGLDGDHGAPSSHSLCGYEFEVQPLSGRFRKRGAVMVFKQALPQAAVPGSSAAGESR